MRVTKQILALSAAVCLTSASALAAGPGDLDTTFGSGGKVVTDFIGGPDSGTDVAVLPDGTIVVAGYGGSEQQPQFEIAQYEPDGALDASFGTDGKVLLPVVGAASALAVQPDGKLVVVGSAGDYAADILVVRLEADGRLDATFGNGGVVRTSLNFYDSAYAVVVQPDGRIVVAGQTEVFERFVAVLRYEPDGRLDATFGVDGVTTFSVGGASWNEPRPRGLALQADGKIVVAGTSGGSYLPADGHIAVARLDTNGALDMGFGTGGIVKTFVGGGAADVLVLPDGKLLVAGHGQDPSGGGSVVLARYQADGALDESFGSGGLARHPIESGGVNGMALDANGMIVTVGSVYRDATTHDFAVSRFGADGVVDGTFAGTGTLRLDLGGYEIAAAVALQGDKVIVAGLAGGFTTFINSDFALLRIHAGPPVDTTPPVLTVPGPLTVVADDPAGAVVTYHVSATDNVDANPMVTCDPASGTLLPPGITTVTCTARDIAGNEAHASFTVTVVEGLKLRLEIERLGSVSLSTGKATVRGRMFCSRDVAYENVFVYLVQAGPAGILAEAYGGLSQPCVAGGVPFEMDMYPVAEGFGGGPATASGVVSACDDYGCANAEATAAVVLRPGVYGHRDDEHPHGIHPIDLGTLGGTNSYATALNDDGRVAGWSLVSDNAATHAFSWTRSTGMIDLGTLGGSNSVAVAVNAAGQIVGNATTADNAEQHAFSWTPSEGMRDLGTLGGGYSEASAVNRPGDVVGVSGTAAGQSHAFTWTPATGMVDLGTLGGTYSVARAINDGGMVVGWSAIIDDAATHAFAWTATGGMRDLGTLGGPFSMAIGVAADGRVIGMSLTSDGRWAGFAWTDATGMRALPTRGGSYTYVYAVSANGQAVGFDVDAQGEGHAVSWSADGLLTDLGVLGSGPGPGYSAAHAVNVHGQVVGSSSTAEGWVHAFSWTAAAGMTDLRTLGGNFSEALVVNADGFVAGYSTLPGNFAQHAVLWRLPRRGTVTR